MVLHSYMDKYVCVPKENQLKIQLSLVKKKKDYINSKEIQKQHLFMRPLAQVNYGIGGFLTSTTKEPPHVSKVLTSLPYLKIDHKGTCKGCTRGKNIKNPFPKSETKTKFLLELIHSYVCGPIPSTYLSGYEYYVTFIDDYSKKT